MFVSAISGTQTPLFIKHPAFQGKSLYMALLFIFTEEKISFRAEKVVFFEKEQENGSIQIKLHYPAGHLRK